MNEVAAYSASGTVGGTIQMYEMLLIPADTPPEQVAHEVLAAFVAALNETLVGMDFPACTPEEVRDFEFKLR
jgi:hypothetical protein